MRPTAAFLVLACACADDPSLRIDVEHPDGVEVATTTVTVYESESLSCAAIEFGDAAEDELRAAEVATVTIGDDDGALAGLSRTRRKLIVARGFDGTRPLTAGCVEHGVIEGDDHAVVSTVVVATLSIGAGEPGDGDAPVIPVTLTDPFGAPLAGRTVTWAVQAASGTSPMASPALLTVGEDRWAPSAQPCTNADGAARLHPVPPAQLGGYAIEVRVSWGTEPPRVFTAMSPLDPDPLFFDALATTTRRCTVRVRGSDRRVVCVEDADPDDTAVAPVARDYPVTVRDGAAELGPASATQPLTGLLPLELVTGIYSVPRGADRDAYAITSRGRIIALFSPTQPPQPPMLFDVANEGLVADVLVMPACTPAQTPQLVVRTTGAQIAPSQRVYTMDPLGGARTRIVGADTGETFDLDSAGCATELPSDVRQVVVVDTGTVTREITVAHFACSAPGGRCSVRLPASRAGAGFTITNGEPRIVAANFDASGTVLASWVFLPDATNARLVERARTPSASFPTTIVSGNFDADDVTDLAWIFPSVATTATNLQLAYARTVLGQPLSALSGPQGGLVLDMLAADVTGDGIDDLVATGQLRDASSMTTRDFVTVIPLHAPTAPLTLSADTTCAR